MSNNFYNHDDGAPLTLTRGSSTVIRSEFDLVQAGFEKMPSGAQQWSGTANYVAAAGPADAWTVTLAATPALFLTAYQDGMQLRVLFPSANATQTPTINVNGLGNKTIAGDAGAPLNAGDIASGGLRTITYSASLGKFVVFLGNSVASAAASASAAGAGAATATAQAGVATAAAGTATGQAGVATSAAATATTQAGVATVASATLGAYPNSASTNVPRGLTQASVGAITAGSGGTNGTFALAWSGGNFSVNPTGTFTVAGGVLTAVTITGPGLYIGASPTVPTPSFAASSGLTGAAVALTAQFLITSGQGYWVQSADGKTLDRYKNVSGVATLDSANVQSVYTINGVPPLSHEGMQVLREKLYETDQFGVRNWIKEVSTDASRFQVAYSGGAARNADGSYTIPAGGSINWNLGSLNNAAAPYGPWKFPSGGGALVPGAGSKRYFAVFQPDPTVSGLTLKVQGFAPNNQLATWTQTAPGLWEGVYTVGSETNIGVQLLVSNSGGGSITVLMPFASTSAFGLLEDFKQPAPPKQLPVRDWKWSFPSSPAGDRNWRERQGTYYVDSVNGASGNAGTNVSAPKQTIAQVPTFGADNVILGLWRGSLFREKGKTGGASDSGGSGGNRKGVILRDIRQGRQGKPLPIISALDTVTNASFVNNGDGTYSYTWTAGDTLLNDGYNIVYIVEINTATEARSPISSARQMNKVASQAAAAAAAGTSYIQNLGAGQWKATIRPTDSLAPGAGTYRYEVVSRLLPCDWFDYSRDGQIEGLHLVGGNSGYGSIGGANYFDADRVVVQHASTHGAVVGSGKLSRSIVYGASDSPSGNIGWTWYATTTPGYISRIEWCYFKDARPAATYGHNTSGGNAAEAVVENCVMDAGLTDSDACTGTAANHNSVDYYAFRSNYVLGAYSLGSGASPTYDLVVENNVFRDVARGVGLTYYGSTNRYYIRNNLFRFRSWSDPANVNNRGAVFFAGTGMGTNLRDKLYVENNLIHLRSTAAALTNDNTVTFEATPYGYYRRNIVILEQFNPAASTGVTYLNGDDTDPTAYTSDYNLVVCNRPLGDVLLNSRRSGGGAFNTGWDQYKAIVGQDANTLWLDVSGDPRGIKAVFVDPANGDYRFANTELGRKAADYCSANGVGPSTVISKWPEIPQVDEAYRMLRDL